MKRSRLLFPIVLMTWLIANSAAGWAGDGLKGEYCDNVNFTALTLTRTDAQVNFAWGNGSPDPSIGIDTFSVRWTGQVQPKYSETYTFYAKTDDGVRLWVNGKLLINKWIDKKATEEGGLIVLTAGRRYDIRMEYYDDAAGAVSQLSWSSPSQVKQIIPQSQLYSSGTVASSTPQAGNGLQGEYYDSVDFTALKLTRTDAQVNFTWGNSSPDPSIGIDTFSVRWTGQVQPQYSETYAFYAKTDDGVRLWVNGKLLIDKWIDKKATEESGLIALIAGQRYGIRMEYYDGAAGAVAQLLWSSPSQVKQIIPQSQLYSSGTGAPPPPPSPVPSLPPPSSGSGGTFNWVKASPWSQGFDIAKLDTMRDVLAIRKTQALLIVRNDRIVYEWYAPSRTATQTHYEASLAKALVGGMSLVVALNDGRIGVDDVAGKYVAKWRNDSLKSKIRIRHLASHTSGIEDAVGPEAWKQAFWARTPDPFSIAIDDAPSLFTPGSDLTYSNPGFAALAYAVTAALKSDIRTVLKQRIMVPIGVPDSEWSIGYGKAYPVDGLNLYATWGGANYTPRAVARVGRLMLRKGNWQGRQLFSSTWASQMVSRAVPVSDSGLCWWTNLDGRWRNLPRDAYGGAGSGHQLLLVVPSLNLIVVRNGGSIISETDFWAGLEEYVFEPLMNAITRK